MGCGCPRRFLGSRVAGLSLHRHLRTLWPAGMLLMNFSVEEFVLLGFPGCWKKSI